MAPYIPLPLLQSLRVQSVDFIDHLHVDTLNESADCRDVLSWVQELNRPILQLVIMRLITSDRLNHV